MKFLLVCLIVCFTGGQVCAGLGLEPKNSLKKERQLSPQLPERVLPGLGLEPAIAERENERGESPMPSPDSLGSISAILEQVPDALNLQKAPQTWRANRNRKSKRSGKGWIFSRKRNKRNADRPRRNLRSILSSLWTFATINYVYADLVGLMDAGMLAEYLVGVVNGITITSGFLLGAAIFMQIPISMIFLSRILKGKTNRKANIIAGIIMSVVQALTLFVGVPSGFYLFFSLVEILATLAIVWLALKSKPADWEPQG